MRILTILALSIGASSAWAAPPASPELIAKGKATYTTTCVACHGEKGDGAGPAAVALTPKPRNFTDPEWQKSVTDAHIENIIKFGGIAVGKSPTMPSNPDLMAKPDVVSALRQVVRSFKK